MKLSQYHDGAESMKIFRLHKFNIHTALYCLFVNMYTYLRSYGIFLLFSFSFFTMNVKVGLAKMKNLFLREGSAANWSDHRTLHLLYYIHPPLWASFWSLILGNISEIISYHILLPPYFTNEYNIIYLILFSVYISSYPRILKVMINLDFSLIEFLR